jgi:hypothetical protein
MVALAVLGAVAIAFAVTISSTMASAAVTDCTNVLNSTAPSLPDFLKAARPLNPGYSDEELKGAWVSTYKDCYISLKGRIGPDDVAIFKRLLARADGYGLLMLSLDSEGGDIATAIEIGRLVRRWPKSLVMVSGDYKCFSACVFVLAGGLHRQVDGRIGIHRPFISTTNSNTYESSQKTFRALEQSAKAFLKDMNIPTSLYDEMMSVPPQKLRLLTEQELARFGIGQNDPAYQDNLDAETARAFGLDKEAYLGRKERADRICGALYFDTKQAGTEVTLLESGDIQDVCKKAVLANKTGRLFESGSDEMKRLSKTLSDRNR